MHIRSASTTIHPPCFSSQHHLPYRTYRPPHMRPRHCHSRPHRYLLHQPPHYHLRHRLVIHTHHPSPASLSPNGAYLFGFSTSSSSYSASSPTSIHCATSSALAATPITAPTDLRQPALKPGSTAHASTRSPAAPPHGPPSR